MSWRVGTAAIAALSLVILPLSISSATADDTVPDTPSASPSASESGSPVATATPEPTDLPALDPSPSAAAPTATDPSEPATKTIIVTFDKAQSDPAEAAQAAVAKVADQVADARVTKVAPITDSMVAVTLDTTLTAAESAQVESQVSDAKGVRAADTARWFRPTMTNDIYYNYLWNVTNAGIYGTHAESAWPISTGANTVVGVIDTGITAHPDLTGSDTSVIGGNVIAGYDFISDPAFAGDGNGRDSDPTDTGDFYTDRLGQHTSSWHGTHVSGIIAALTGNGAGVAGVAPDAKVEPLRALGRGGGSETDVIAAILWGAGLPVKGLPTNSRPAQVLNLSLGNTDPSPCGGPMQSAIDDATAKGVIVVVAAGNSSAAARKYSPANCRNVISVGSTNSAGQLASYSNYGGPTELTISAPGDGILSTINRGSTTATYAGYSYMSGTSMAAPHVAAIAALLKSVEPTLLTSQVTEILRATAKAGCSKSACGSGIAQANTAVATLSSNIQSAETASTEPTGTFTITGTPRVGSTLSASAARSIVSAAYGYEWSRNGAPIASGPTLTLTAADANAVIQVRVTGKLAGYSWSSESSPTSAVGPGILSKSKSPTATGTFRAGKTVSASKGTWSPSPSSYSYRWLRNGKSISGATKSKYKLTSKDRGKKISVRVTVSKPGYTTTSATSSSHSVKR
ncbi:S8 family serine peptidase [Propionicimonas paludicola]|uniref:S8 family serine peptidase n=1 Tax=Propionicimonas paludicola TaxID=185243 RepID=UPI0011799EEF|nr:S8 family serine peptidase [Propionicimonas paludicola]